MYYNGTGSERLSYRPLTRDDIPSWAEFYTYPEARQHLVFLNGKTPLDSSIHVIEKQLTRYANGLFGMHAIIHKESEDFVGIGGLLRQTINGKQEVEVGYHLFPKFWHQGYASETAQHFRDFGFHNRFSSSIVSVINAQNTPSQKVALSNGMKKDGHTTYEDLVHHIFRITREEWQAIPRESLV